MGGREPLKKPLGIATLNALSASCEPRIGMKGYDLELGTDTLEGLEIREEDNVVVVGALVSMLRRLKAKAKPFPERFTDVDIFKGRQRPTSKFSAMQS